MKKSPAIFRICGYIVILSILLSCFVGCKTKSQSDETENNGNTTVPSDYEPGNSTVQDASLPNTEPEETKPSDNEPEETLPDTYQIAIVNIPALIVRREPGEDQDAIRKLNEGDEIRVYAQKTVNGVIWGNVGDGWINLNDVIWKDDVEISDTALQGQVVGSWYQLYEEGAEVWTFRSSGSFSYDVYIFDVSGPGTFGESNDEWCGGTYQVKNGKLVISFTDRIDSGRFTVLCGNSYYYGDTARISLSVNADEMTLKDTQTVTFHRGDIYQIMEERNTVTEEDQAIIDQLLGSWYEEADSSQPSEYRMITFRNDGRFFHNTYAFDLQNPTKYTEDSKLSCQGSYTVKNGILILHFNGNMASDAEISLAGIPCKKDDTLSFSILLDETTLKISEFATTTLTRGTLEELIDLLVQNAQPPVVDPVTDSRIFGEWYIITDIDYENMSLMVGSCLTFSSDGTFIGTQFPATRYLYDQQTGELIYDPNQLGSGSVEYWGTYTFDGTTLTMVETGNEFDIPLMTVVCTVTFSDNTMTHTDESNITTVYYPVTWENIGPYFFGDGT